MSAPAQLRGRLLDALLAAAEPAADRLAEWVTRRVQAAREARRARQRATPGPRVHQHHRGRAASAPRSGFRFAELRRAQDELQARVEALEAAPAAPRRPDLELVDAIDAALADPALTLERARELLAAASSELETLDVLAAPHALTRLERSRDEAERGEVVGMDVIRADLERRRSWSPGQAGVEARQGQGRPESRAEAR